jgi:hypothetical protein
MLPLKHNRYTLMIYSICLESKLMHVSAETRRAVYFPNWDFIQRRKCASANSWVQSSQ